jgi:acyl-CoA dehydrogenase
MSDVAIFESSERLFRGVFNRSAVRRSATGEFLAEEWRALAEAGLPLAMVPADRGGAGLEVADAADLLRLVGHWAAPVPLSEMMLGAALLARAGLDIGEGIVTIAPPANAKVCLAREDGRWRLTGEVRRVPWARHCEAVVVAVEFDDQLNIVRLPLERCRIAHGANLAGEPRDDIAFETVIEPADVAPIKALSLSDVHAAGAALRCVMIGGAANRVLDLSVAYSLEREQFGRRIAAFQAVQQNLAIIAGQAAICRAAGDLAAQSILEPGGDFPIAIAKARIGEAASDAAHLAHQVHGAMGFTDEYDLHLFTKRIWAWREEFGAEAEWARFVGQTTLAAEANAWAVITDRAGRLS